MTDHYLAITARSRTANWVDSIIGKILVDPSTPPSLVSDTDNRVSFQGFHNDLIAACSLTRTADWVDSITGKTLEDPSSPPSPVSDTDNHVGFQSFDNGLSSQGPDDSLIAARTRTANWVNSITGKTLEDPSGPPSLVSDTENSQDSNNGLSCQGSDDDLSSDSDTDSSHSLPPRRYPDGRPDVTVSRPLGGQKPLSTSLMYPNHDASWTPPGSHVHHPSNPDMRSRVSSNVIPLYVIRPPPVIATHPETTQSPTATGPLSIQQTSSQSHCAPMTLTRKGFQPPQPPPPLPPPPGSIIASSPVYGFPSPTSPPESPQAALPTGSKSTQRAHSYPSNHSYPHTPAQPSSNPAPQPTLYHSGSTTQAPRRHSSRAGSSSHIGPRPHPPSQLSHVDSQKIGFHTGSGTSPSRLHGPAPHSIVYASSSFHGDDLHIGGLSSSLVTIGPPTNHENPQLRQYPSSTLLQSNGSICHSSFTTTPSYSSLTEVGNSIAEVRPPGHDHSLQLLAGLKFKDIQL